MCEAGVTSLFWEKDLWASVLTTQAEFSANTVPWLASPQLQMQIVQLTQAESETTNPDQRNRGRGPKE